MVSITEAEIIKLPDLSLVVPLPEDIFMILIKLPSKESATIFPSITLDCEKLIAGITKIDEKKILIRKGSLIDEN